MSLDKLPLLLERAEADRQFLIELKGLRQDASSQQAMAKIIARHVLGPRLILKGASGGDTMNIKEFLLKQLLETFADVLSDEKCPQILQSALQKTGRTEIYARDGELVISECTDMIKPEVRALYEDSDPDDWNDSMCVSGDLGPVLLDIHNLIHESGSPALQKVLEKHLGKPLSRRAIVDACQLRSDEEVEDLMNLAKGSQFENIYAGLPLECKEFVFTSVPYDDFVKRFYETDMLLLLHIAAGLRTGKIGPKSPK